MTAEQELQQAVALLSLRLLFWETAIASRDGHDVLALAIETSSDRAASNAIAKACRSRRDKQRKIAEALASSGINPGLMRQATSDEATLGVLAEYEERRRLFVEANLRFAIKIAHRSPRSRLSIEDRIQEGTIGLMRAVDGFDPHRGFRFSTYAMWWVRHHVYRASTSNRGPVRIPQNIVTTHMRLTRSRREMTATLGREPSDQEVAADTGIEISKIRRVDAAMNIECMSFDSLANSNTDLSADSFDGVELDNAAMVQRAMECLSPKLRSILVERFGLENNETRTLNEIGNEFGVSRERIRQLQNMALDEMRDALRVA